MKVGVILPLGGDEGEVPSYATIRSLALAIENSVLDSAWVYDHLVYRFPDKPTQGIQEAWTTLTALAEATNRIELGCLVFCVPFRNPAVLAKMAVTLQEVSDNRFILGLGAGWHKPEFDAFGISFEHLVDRFEEALKIIVPLVKTGKVDFTGVYYSAPNCELIPRPNGDGVPVLIASFKPRMLMLTAQYADLWNTAWLGHAEALALRSAELDAALGEVGRDPKSLAVTAGINVAFPELGAERESFERDKVIAGTIKEVAEGLRAYREAGVEHLIVALDPSTEMGVAKLSDAWELARG